jgi:peptidyl-prolyl cis-trans isomerase D
MLSSFRRLTKSRVGLVIVFAFLGVIALAFGMSDLTGLGGGGAGSRNALVKVGDREITDAEMRQRVDVALTNMRRQGRALTVEDFISQGGFEVALEQTINALALEEFGRQTGMNVSKALVDGEIASNPAFQGLDGRFNQKTFDDLLARERISPKALRDDMARERYGRWLIARFDGAPRVPDSLVSPYASLMLERRQGLAGLIRTIDMDPGPNPDDKTLTAFYTANRGRYTVPERRVLRYTIVKADALRAANAATEAEIADAYGKAGARFAATEKRTLQQLILPDQTTANNVANQVKGGQSIADAARAAGLEPSSFEGIEKPALATQTSPAIADAAFGAAADAVVGPLRSPIGWHVLRVQSVEKVAAKSLDLARPELAEEIGKRKLAEALARLRQTAEDRIGDGATFDELMAETKLAGSRTAPIIAAGINPEDAEPKPDPALAPVVQAGFAIEPDSQEPVIAQVDQEGGFAIVGLERVVAAAPRPLAAIREQVNRDYLVDKALQLARTKAADVVKQVAAGKTLQQALADAGATRPPPERFDIRRAEVRPGAAAHVRMAFAMAPKTAKLVEAPDRAGYFVVYLDSVEERDARSDPALMERTRGEIGQQLGPEYGAQFMESVRRFLKVTRNDAAIARLKAELTGARNR